MSIAMWRIVALACCVAVGEGLWTAPSGRSHRHPNLDKLISRVDKRPSGHSLRPLSQHHHHTVTVRSTTVSPPLDESDSDKLGDVIWNSLTEDDGWPDEEVTTREPSWRSASFPKDTQADSVQRSAFSFPTSTRSGRYSETKWKTLGTRGGVENVFKSQARSSEWAGGNQAFWDKVKATQQQTKCRAPRPKVVRVGDVYPSTAKSYIPECVVLHQCGEDTGCCHFAAQRCGPRTTNRVQFSFFVSYLVPLSHNQRQHSQTGLETLPFYNHTECECQDKAEESMPRDAALYNAVELRTTQQGSQCRCPSEFTVRVSSNGSCSCDCFDKQRDCIKYKKGKEYFQHQDRVCIEMKTCLVPSCDFGVYLRVKGRCPLKNEKFRSWPR